MRRNLWTFGHHDYHMILSYSCQHSHFWYLQNLFREFFPKLQNVLLPLKRNKDFLFSLNLSCRWITLAPIHFRCHEARPVIYYDFIIGWLLPSPPPGCRGLITSFSTQWLLRDLNEQSGLFPSWHKTLAPYVCLHSKNPHVFGVSLGSVKLWATLTQRVLYPMWFKKYALPQ